MAGYPGRVKAANVVLTGVPELDKKLKDISIRVARKASMAALGVGARMVATAERREVPIATTPGHSNESMKKSIRSRVTRQRSTGIMTAKAGVDVGLNKKTKNSIGKAKKKRHGSAHWIAAGTKVRYTKKGASRGAIKPNRFIRKAYGAVAASALSAMLAKAGEVIEKEAAKG